MFYFIARVYDVCFRVILTPSTSPVDTCVMSSSSDPTISSGSEANTEASACLLATVQDSKIKPEGVSKNQWKRQLKQKKFEESKVAWRKKQKEKRKEKRKQQRLDDGGGMSQAKRTKMADAGASNIRVAIEFQYESLMNDKDIKKLIKQCQRCYSANRRAESPLQLYFTSFEGRMKEMMDKSHQYAEKWDVHVRKHNYLEEFDKKDIVFLAAESENVLTELDPAKVYIIGGLVDHNHHKGYCYQQALDKGISHAQLPIASYVQLNSRAVLTVNHVFEILLAYVQNHDWKKAFTCVIPERKVLTKKFVKDEEPEPSSELTPTSDASDSGTA
eukprot:Em0068g4a